MGFLEKLHLLTNVAHDEIWDAQGWFSGTVGRAAGNIRERWATLTAGLSWWSPWRFLRLGMSIPKFALLGVVATAATVLALSLSLTIDLAKLAVFSFCGIFIGAYHLVKQGWALCKRLFSRSPQLKKELDNESPSPDPQIIKCSSDQRNWFEIMSFARLAPSPHNMQPWIFDITSATEATLKYDPQRLLPDTNPAGSYVFVGFGMLFETMSIAAAPLGKEVEVTLESKELHSNLKGPQRLATLRIIDREQKEPETLTRQNIEDRRTSRLPYNGAALSEPLLQELQALAAQPRYGHTMGYSTIRADVNWTIQLNAEAMHADMSNRRTRNELRSWMRFSKKDAEKQADGLAAYAMNTPAWQLWLFANVNWLFRIPGVAQVARYFYKRSMSGTATVTWLSGPFATPDDWVKAGRLMARWWLTMAKHQVNIHPFGSVITNPEAYQQMENHFRPGMSAEDKENNPIWMLTRNGYSRSNETPPQAQRKPLSQIVTSSNNWFNLFPSSAAPAEAADKEKAPAQQPALALAPK